MALQYLRMQRQRQKLKLVQLVIITRSLNLAEKTSLANFDIYLQVKSISWDRVLTLAFAYDAISSDNLYTKISAASI
ncbi:uncharacterized protein PHALS_08220 [Plasmopara halstedii]|uniref:Uncharacterized protein n=1 Tax=Plasmopara halstedii TaxID=4781 RepID=A0A0P1ABH2_PLAHL|nr:uncharacterized protein PHALS_08220 [Plasmopara halstedii]CEG38128.1 hypothetical protein PHALS_08220 [Plasmopara halstedii]|eukprot:XP_024574497.1 hypothetical protein PHALS_08220 [Plasmopara halstedii]